MKHWYLSQYFKTIATKRVSAVEVNKVTSNQHEFNWTNELKRLFGEVWSEKINIKAKFLYLNDYDDEIIEDTWVLTWYDARARSFEKTGRTEYRLYFPDTNVLNCASEWDLLIIAQEPSWEALVIIAENESTILNQLLWLFGISESHPWFSIKSELETEQDRIEFASRMILETIGIEIEMSNENYLDDMLRRFWNNTFPLTKVFSEYARSTIQKEAIKEEKADSLILMFMEKEEILFRTFEKYLLAERLSKWFMNEWNPDVDSFINFSLHVQNRRKSRAWAGFENHLEYIFQSQWVRFSRTGITENKSKPDFIFPWIMEYRDQNFPNSKLNILWAKTSCKDRWRQVLSEANRVDDKHLITLQTAISETQTDEMRIHKLQLVIPTRLQQTYTQRQQDWLIWLDDFIIVVRNNLL